MIPGWERFRGKMISVLDVLNSRCCGMSGVGRCAGDCIWMDLVVGDEATSRDRD